MRYKDVKIGMEVWITSKTAGTPKKDITPFKGFVKRGVIDFDDKTEVFLIDGDKESNFYHPRDFEPHNSQGKKTPCTCLFCGNSKPKVVELQGSHFVACMDCEARGPRKATASDAVVAWNTHITVGVINA